MSENRSYNNRKIFFYFLFSITGFIFIIKLFLIQVVDDKYKESANNNALRYMYEYPARGLVYDRFGKLIVYNSATFDLMVIPRETESFDTLRLCEIIGITKTEYDKRMKKAINLSGYHQPSILDSDLPAEVYSRFQEESSSFKGFYIQSRTKRAYTLPVAPHTLGYIGEASPMIIEKDPYYRSGDYIGINGLEKTYEKELRGEKGLRVMVVDVHNTVQGSYKNGELDREPLSGKDLYSTLDLELQNYAESLMVNKRGGIVAIEPATGEVLAIVSEPSYDPNLLVGRTRSKHYLELQNDVQNHPLYNRAIMTRYPPGSTFKVVNGLAGLQEGIFDDRTMFSCFGGYRLSESHTIDCHAHPSPLAIRSAVAYSCNTWFCWAFKKFVDSDKFTSSREGYERWRNYIYKLGYGHALGIDLPNEFGGYVPEVDYYDRMFGHKKWHANSIVSVAIGQGEIGATPLQLANLTAIIANRGYYITPHVIRAIGSEKNLNTKYMERHETGIDKSHYEIIADGMEMAVLSGTATVAQMNGVVVCAKTGTAQDPPRKNHSVFIAFAPKVNPKIAIAVLVENSGFGATYAGPIASLMIEYYLNRKIERKDLEERIINTVLLNPNQ
ncbi:MAG TPA: penicillin-binding protein 2 [Bacteroidales bacterium]|nr:penicillin-binding protein 2 [Bacteroidales bacterium]